MIKTARTTTNNTATSIGPVGIPPFGFGGCAEGIGGVGGVELSVGIGFSPGVGFGIGGVAGGVGPVGIVSSGVFVVSVGVGEALTEFCGAGGLASLSSSSPEVSSPASGLFDALLLSAVGLFGIEGLPLIEGATDDIGLGAADDAGSSSGLSVGVDIGSLLPVDSSDDILISVLVSVLVIGSVGLVDGGVLVGVAFVDGAFCSS
jgi:hypothetical protein